MNLKQIIVFVFLMLTISCSQSTHDKLIGEWKGTDNSGVSMSLVFESDGNAKMINGSAVLDGQSIGGKVEWRLNEEIFPHQLDIIATGTKRQGSLTIPMIARLITIDKLQLRMNKDMQTRPIEFSNTDQENQIILIRQK
jgi:hypothetical protein